MDAGLGLQPAIGILALDQQGGGFQPSFLAGLLLNHLHFVTAGIGPACVHAGHHGGPVLALRPAGAGMDFQIAVIAIGLAGQKRFQFGALHFALQGFQAFDGIVDNTLIVFHLSQLDQFERVGKFGFRFLDDRHCIVEPVTLAHQGLGLLTVIPEVRGFGHGIEFV